MALVTRINHGASTAGYDADEVNMIEDRIQKAVYEQDVGTHEESGT